MQAYSPRQLEERRGSGEPEGKRPRRNPSGVRSTTPAEAYRAAHQGLVPAKFLGRRIVVPKAALHRFLGDSEASSGGDEAA